MKELNMGFQNWLRGDATRPVEDHALSGGGYSFFFGATSSGRPVTERSAMQMTAVYSCVRILADEVNGLYPLMPNGMTVGRDEFGRLYYEYQRTWDEPTGR